MKTMKQRGNIVLYRDGNITIKKAMEEKMIAESSTHVSRVLYDRVEGYKETVIQQLKRLITDQGYIVTDWSTLDVTTENRSKCRGCEDSLFVRLTVEADGKLD